MSKALHKTILLDAPPSAVWQALTTPEIIKQYFFGTDTSGEWKKGNEIIYKGEWQGKKFTGKGTVIDAEKEKLLKHTYWSSMSGLKDDPSNYHIVTYELSEYKDGTRLNLTEENLADEAMKERSDKTWDMVFDNLKKVLEKESVG